MPIIPHAHWFFDVVGLLLRADDESSDWAMTAGEAVGYVDAIGGFVPADHRDRTGIFASPLPVLLLGGDPIGRLDDLDPILWRSNSFGLA